MALTETTLRAALSDLFTADHFILAAYQRIQGQVANAEKLVAASQYLAQVRLALNELLDEGTGGGVDHTAQLQNLLNAALAANAPAVLPAGAFNISAPLRLWAPAGQRRAASIVGAGMGSTVITWTGPGGQPMLHLQGLFQASFQGFTLRGNTAARPSAGLYFPALVDVGAGACAFRQLYVEGCRRGFDFGGALDRQVSECTLESCEARDCSEAGFRVEGWNALGFLFHNCHGGYTPTMFHIERSNAHSVVGGSFTNVGVVYRTNAGGPHNLQGVRAENTQRLADLGSMLDGGGVGATMAPIQFRAHGCQMIRDAASTVNQPAMRVYNPGPTRVESCQFYAGHIEQMLLGNWFGALDVTDCVFDKSDARGVVVTGSGANRGVVRIANSRICSLQPPAGGEAVSRLEREQVL